MTALTFIAMFALAMSVGGWLGVRYTNAIHDLDGDIARFVLTVPITDKDNTDA